MKKFVKGNLVTIVEDDDRRIPAYVKNGWKETEYAPKPQTEAEKRMDKAVEEVLERRGKKPKRPIEDKKVNEAINATETAHKESEPVDDGLLKGDE